VNNLGDGRQIRNQQVAGSIPAGGSIPLSILLSILPGKTSFDNSVWTADGYRQLYAALSWILAPDGS